LAVAPYLEEVAQPVWGVAWLLEGVEGVRVLGPGLLQEEGVVVVGQEMTLKLVVS
jgi:hypothetical protein